MLNLILASLFFAGGYALAYFTVPRETVIIREPIVYNNTVVYNYTVPIENTTVIVINDTRIINNTVVINNTQIIVIQPNQTVYVNQPITVNASRFRLEFTIRNVSYWIQPILLNGFWFNITLNLTAKLYDIATGKEYVAPLPALRVAVEYNTTHIYVYLGNTPLQGTSSFSGTWVLSIRGESGGWDYVAVWSTVSEVRDTEPLEQFEPLTLIGWYVNVQFAYVDSRYF